jgi:hypothetical protein
MEMSSDKYIEEIRKLQDELHAITKECQEWRERFERTLLWQKQPRLPVRGITNHLDCVGINNGKVSTQTYTTVGWRDGDDYK